MATQTTTGSRAQESVSRLRAQRDEIFRDVAQVEDAALRAPAQWGGTTRNVSFLLRAHGLHEMDHLQHLQRLLLARGHRYSEAALLLTKLQAMRGEMESLLLSLSDEDFVKPGPKDGDWSAEQIAQHLLEVDARYGNELKLAVARFREGSPPDI